MLEYFKENPAALMDALPTPKGSEEGDELGDFKTGLTPKKNFTSKLGARADGVNRPGAKYFGPPERRESSIMSSRSVRSAKSTPRKTL